MHFTPKFLQKPSPYLFWFDAMIVVIRAALQIQESRIVQPITDAADATGRD